MMLKTTAIYVLIQFPDNKNNNIIQFPVNKNNNISICTLCRPAGETLFTKNNGISNSKTMVFQIQTMT
jgi:hypothetical protein